MTEHTVTAAGPTFARTVGAYTDTAPERGRDEYEVAILPDGSVLLDVHAHSPRKERITVPADHALAVNLRGLLAAARAGAIA